MFSNVNVSIAPVYTPLKHLSIPPPQFQIPRNNHDNLSITTGINTNIQVSRVQRNKDWGEITFFCRIEVGSKIYTQSCICVVIQTKDLYDVVYNSER